MLSISQGPLLSPLESLSTGFSDDDTLSNHGHRPKFEIIACVYAVIHSPDNTEELPLTRVASADSLSIKCSQSALLSKRWAQLWRMRAGPTASISKISKWSPADAALDQVCRTSKGRAMYPPTTCPFGHHKAMPTPAPSPSPSEYDRYTGLDERDTGISLGRRDSMLVTQNLHAASIWLLRT